MSPNLPKTFKAARFVKKDAPLTIEDVELKQPGEGEVLIKVLATGVCHSDAYVSPGMFGNSLSVSPISIKSIALILMYFVAPEHLVTKQSVPSLLLDQEKNNGRLMIAWVDRGMVDMMVEALHSIGTNSRG